VNSEEVKSKNPERFRIQDFWQAWLKWISEELLYPKTKAED